MTKAQREAEREARALQRFRRLAKSDRLRELREEQGLSQAATGRAVGVARSQVSRWEAGTQTPRPRHALAILALLEELP